VQKTLWQKKKKKETTMYLQKSSRKSRGVKRRDPVVIRKDTRKEGGLGTSFEINQELARAETSRRKGDPSGSVWASSQKRRGESAIKWENVEKANGKRSHGAVRPPVGIEVGKRMICRKRPEGQRRSPRQIS